MLIFIVKFTVMKRVSQNLKMNKINLNATLKLDVTINIRTLQKNCNFIYISVYIFI
jgi:hypothetical protein